MTAAIELSIQRRATEDPQELRIIWDGSDGINRQVNEEQSGSRRFDFILVGKYDADLAIGDFWEEGSQKFIIESIFPSNDWEVKAGGISHGSTPS